MSRTERAAKGTLVSVLQYFILISIQLILTPVILRVAGQEVLGAFSILMQVIGYFALADLGFSVALSRYLEQAYGASDAGARFRNVLTTGRTFRLVTNTVLASLVIAYGFYGVHLLSLSDEIASQARLSLFVLAIWSIAKTPWSVFASALVATQDLTRAHFITIAGNIVRLSLSLILIVAGFGLFGLVLAVMASEALNLLLSTRRFRRMNINLLPGWGIPDRALFRSMFGFGIQALFMSIAVRLVFQTDSIVVGYLYGAASVSVYYTTQMPTTIGYQLINRLNDNATPAINELYSKSKLVSLRNAYINLSRYTVILASLLGVGVLLFNQKLITLWVGPEQYAGNAMTVALAMFAFLISVGHLSNAFVIASGRIKTLSALSMIEGVLNIGMSLVLGRFIGIAGVMIATVIANIPTTFYMQWRVMRMNSVSLTEYADMVAKPVILPLILSLVSLFAVHAILPQEIPYSVFVDILVLVVSYAVAVYIFCFSSSERKWLKSQMDSSVNTLRREVATRVANW